MEKQEKGHGFISEQDIKENKLVAAMSYIWILCLVPLLAKRKSNFAQFHAKQGLVLFVLEIVAGIIAWFPILGQLLVVGLTIVAIMAVIRALNGEVWEIPYIYKWSQKINL